MGAGDCVAPDRLALATHDGRGQALGGCFEVPRHPSHRPRGRTRHITDQAELPARIAAGIKFQDASQIYPDNVCLDRSVEKPRFSKFGAMLKFSLLSVMALKILFRFPEMPFSDIDSLRFKYNHAVVYEMAA